MKAKGLVAVIGVVLGAGSVSRAVPGQVPPRRMNLGTGAPSTRGSDLSDGTALPAWVRSVRIEREGEVLRVSADLRSARRGAAARGARLPALEATQGNGCRGYWIRVGSEAWLCSDGVELSAEGPSAVALPVVPDGEVVPYPYAFATRAGVRTYRRLEDIAEDDWAEELERGMSIAVVGTARVDGAVYVHAASGRWVALRELAWARPSERAGVLYEPGESVTSVGFLRVEARAWPTPEGALRDRGPSAGTVLLGRRDGVHVREERLVRGRGVVRVDAGWVAARHLLRPEVTAVPGDLGARERWVDVDRTRQMLLAFEGVVPVFAALVSTGRPGSPTVAGEHRVWAKLSTTDMSNVDDPEIDTVAALYTVSRVPWVMFFHQDQALHGAFWHDGFGRVHSHGCVNLSPRDAAWLYHWAPPAVPPGWTAAIPTAREPGMRVRVR